jgi:hypothetical protein
MSNKKKREKPPKPSDELLNKGYTWAWSEKWWRWTVVKRKSYTRSTDEEQKDTDS